MARGRPNVPSDRRRRDVAEARRRLSLDDNNSSPVSNNCSDTATDQDSSPIIPSRPSQSNPACEITRNLGLSTARGVVETTSRSNDQNHDNSVPTFQDQLKAFFERQESFNKRIEESLAAEQKERENGRGSRKRLPKALTASVREVYKCLLGPNRQKLEWNLQKSFCDQENTEVNNMLMASVRSTDAETPLVQIRAAMRVHFRTRKRQQKLKDLKKDDKVLKEQRRRSRLNTKRVNRATMLSKSTTILEEEKRKYLECMTAEYMSSEHSVSEPDASNDENGSDSESNFPSRKKAFSVRPLTWRSQELSNLMLSLDRKLKRRKSARSVSMAIERRTGPPSTRLAPDDAQPFALL